MKYNNKIKILLLTTLTIGSPQLLAANFCVTNSTEFQAALSTARNNGEDDHIKLTVGDFPAINSQSFVYSASQTETYDLKISGSWTSLPLFPCFLSQNSAFETTLGGSSFDRRLKIIGRGDAKIEIADLVFFEGFATNEVGGGLLITTFTDQAMTILIERSAFNSNTAQHGSAIAIIGGHDITLRSNYVFLNHAESSSAVYFYHDFNSQTNQRDIYLTNNTIMGNSTIGSSSSNTAAVYISPVGDYRAFIANNIFWGNEIKDLIFGAADNPEIYLYHNLIGDFTGTPTLAAGNISEEPELMTSNPFSPPQYNGNLYNKGVFTENLTPITPPFDIHWGMGDYDAHGNDRIRNGEVDIGAAETPSDVIFKDGFE